jgi:hypothetical protein
MCIAWTALGQFLRHTSTETVEITGVAGLTSHSVHCDGTFLLITFTELNQSFQQMHLLTYM